MGNAPDLTTSGVSSWVIALQWGKRYHAIWLRVSLLYCAFKAYKVV